MPFVNSVYYNSLINAVINRSVSKNWPLAVLEWDVVDCIEDPSLSSSCVCGKENLKYLFTIKNIHNNKSLFPIGSTCIRKFERSDLNDIVSHKEGLFKLLHAIDNNEFITLSSEYFTRKLIEYFLVAGVFKASQYNQYDARIDYEFLLKMFNKRDKASISPKQQAKIRAVIIGEIRPYLQSILKKKIMKV